MLNLVSTFFFTIFISELNFSSTGTLPTLTHDRWPLVVGAHFVIDAAGGPASALSSPAGSSLLMVDSAFMCRCKRFCAASIAKRVGQCVSMMMELNMLWHNEERFYAILKHCSVIGNLEACFILGLDEVYNWGRKELGMYYLNKAMIDGHDGATYAVGILLFGDPATQQLGMKILNKLSYVLGATTDPESTMSTSPHIKRCRMEMLSVMTSIPWYSGPETQGNRCKMCRRAKGWEDRIIFCSQLCMWNFEYLGLYRWW